MLEALGSYPWWLLLLAAIGLVALSTVVLTLFSSIGDRPASAAITADCSVGSDDFLRALAGSVNSPLQRGGSVRLLNNGDEFFPALLEAIGGARRSVNLMLYIWEPGHVSDHVFEALIERARAGVEVRVMVDGLGGFKAPDAGIEALRAAGGRWEWFHPPRFGKLTRFHKRNHRRAVVVDGCIGFTGGMAVDDQWLGDGLQPGRWRDCMVEVRGPVASNLQSAFVQLWAQVTGEMLVGEAFYPADAGSLVDGAGEPISRHVNIISSPSNESHPLRRVFWLSIHAARERICITNPYFVPDDIMCAVLQERARAGVDVRVLVPGDTIDIALIRWASHSYYERLLEAGVRIWEFQPNMIHQKLMVVDGLWSIVGSANMDVRSKELNQENVLGILDRGFAEELERVFHADVAHAREIRLDAWRRRPWWHRVPERMALLFEEQF